MNLLPILLGFLYSLDFMLDRNGDEPLGTSAWEAKGAALRHQIANLGSVALLAISDNSLVMLVWMILRSPLERFQGLNIVDELDSVRYISLACALRI